MARGESRQKSVTVGQLKMGNTVGSAENGEQRVRERQRSRKSFSCSFFYLLLLLFLSFISNCKNKTLLVYSYLRERNFFSLESYIYI